MKTLKEVINEVYNYDVLSGETHVDSTRLNEDEYLERLFREIVDDAAYNLDKDFRVKLNPSDVANIVINAMNKYKNFK